MNMYYGNPFESRCAVCGKKMGEIALSDWEICDECANRKNELKKDEDKWEEEGK